MSIGVALPASWRTVDLDPLTRQQSMVRLVEEAISSGDGADRSRALMLEMLRQAADEAVRVDAVVIAVYSAAADGIPLAGSLVASLKEATPPSSGGLLPDGKAMADSLEATLKADGATRLDLPAGPGIRVRSRQASGERSPLEVENVQWYVLHPTGARLALLSFSTPNLALAEPFGEVFDAIAWSLQWME